MDNIEAILDELEKEGFVIIPGALDASEVEEVRVHINQARGSSHAREATRAPFPSR